MGPRLERAQNHPKAMCHHPPDILTAGNEISSYSTYDALTINDGCLKRKQFKMIFGIVNQQTQHAVIPWKWFKTAVKLEITSSHLSFMSLHVHPSCTWQLKQFSKGSTGTKVLNFVPSLT